MILSSIVSKPNLLKLARNYIISPISHVLDDYSKYYAIMNINLIVFCKETKVLPNIILLPNGYEIYAQNL